MRIAFCDDDPRLTELLADYTQAWAETRGAGVDLQSFNSSDEFLRLWTSSTMFDVIFLDIKMKPLSGLELARVIRSIDKNVSLVFITAYSEYALDGYDVDAAQYLLKPVSRDTFFDCMDKLVNRMATPQRKNILIEKNGTTIKIHLDEILYCEARSHVIDVHTTKGVVDYRSRFSDLDKSLSSEDGFIRIHRSFLVNLALVREMSKTEVLMENGDRLPVSRSYAREAYNEYIRFSVA